LNLLKCLFHPFWPGQSEKFNLLNGNKRLLREACIVKRILDIQALIAYSPLNPNQFQSNSYHNSISSKIPALELSFLEQLMKRRYCVKLPMRSL